MNEKTSETLSEGWEPVELMMADEKLLKELEELEFAWCGVACMGMDPKN
ncbi:MAG: hypothetical protein LKI67_09645 [Olsenella sp.]|jgi:hypothetical protein|nr:hypothetical protein [Olsenella sp.]MCH3957184.1 hypothetical protein [Olsenella sp.]MCI1646552.1 hypothetical protein [Olsenella sp.]MCI1794412.1 hypothetical protein [Olsenella sp.]MCI1812099.1 hypothetical protein [Olsenella sp.]